MRADPRYPPGALELLRRIAEAPSGMIVPRTGVGAGGASSDPLDELDRLYMEGLIVNVRIVKARGDPLAPVAFSARLTSAGQASLSRSRSTT